MAENTVSSFSILAQIPFPFLLLHFLPDLTEVLFPLEVPAPGLPGLVALCFMPFPRLSVSTLAVTLCLNSAVFLVIEVVVDLFLGTFTLFETSFHSSTGAVRPFDSLAK